VSITISFYSYFRELTGCETVGEELPPGTTLGELFERISDRFPRLQAMRKSTLMAVGVEYQDSSYRLRDGDAVSFFPPVQGG
jgi:molybdopterin converting factor small subunit